MDGFDEFKIMERWVRERMSSFVVEVAIFESHSNNGRNGYSSELLHFFFSLLKFLLGPTRLVPLPGNGIIQQEILWSKLYYIAVGNLNSEEVEVQLNFTIKGFLYNTTQAYYKCSLSHRLCSLKLFLLRENVAVLTSSATEQEAIVVGRSFASIKGYHLDGNKEILAMGFMNIAGSLTSCYAATGALTHTLSTLVPVIGASGFATTAAATAIGTVVDNFR
ncbi:hypothetical protein HYC85_017418 [Camellia sinensis]|uniref:E3 ubiquitin-protein ligase APD1-4 middle domain-containing protein n=1 Tax=Camellia sinensis TaxID=4442 RepID=A0A7J7GTU7_CAMSI|nr:hypothetical protein HYC85_017418 [Camellia sinensis]